MGRDVEALQAQEEQILEMAKAKGVQSDYFFTTTFHRYQKQIQILSGLEDAIDEHGTMISKINVKGGENLVINPAIVEYNKTVAVANGTVTALLKIINNRTDESGSKDALSDFLADG